jgi:hypothetical protein
LDVFLLFITQMAFMQLNDLYPPSLVVINFCFTTFEIIHSDDDKRRDLFIIPTKRQFFTFNKNNPRNNFMQQLLKLHKIHKP